MLTGTGRFYDGDTREKETHLLVRVRAWEVGSVAG